MSSYIWKPYFKLRSWLVGPWCDVELKPVLVLLLLINTTSYPEATQGLFLFLLRVYEFQVISQRNRHGAAAHLQLLPCDSIGSVASRSKSCLLFMSPCLMLRCLVLTAFFKSLLKYSVMHHNIYSKESPDCINYYRWYETTAGLAVDCKSSASAFLSAVLCNLTCQ